MYYSKTGGDYLKNLIIFVFCLVLLSSTGFACLTNSTQIEAINNLANITNVSNTTLFELFCDIDSRAELANLKIKTDSIDIRTTNLEVTTNTFDTRLSGIISITPDYLEEYWNNRSETLNANFSDYIHKEFSSRQLEMANTTILLINNQMRSTISQFDDRMKGLKSKYVSIQEYNTGIVNMTNYAIKQGVEARGTDFTIVALVALVFGVIWIVSKGKGLGHIKLPLGFIPGKPKSLEESATSHTHQLHKEQLQGFRTFIANSKDTKSGAVKAAVLKMIISGKIRTKEDIKREIKLLDAEYKY